MHKSPTPTRELSSLGSSKGALAPTSRRLLRNRSSRDGRPPWLPSVEAAAAGIAAAIYGVDNAVLMGVSAARIHGVIPRALATAVVSVPKQHRLIALTDRSAVIQFVKRDIDRLDAERIQTPLGSALATSPEQTILDLAHRPSLGDAEMEVPSAIADLYTRSAEKRVAALAADQRLMASLQRAEAWAGAQRGR